MIDGYKVFLDDRVFVSGIGYGNIVSIGKDGGFTVKTGNGELHFRDGGYLGNQRRVYWQDPIILTPPKDKRLWKSFNILAKLLYTQLETMSIKGQITDEDI